MPLSWTTNGPTGSRARLTAITKECGFASELHAEPGPDPGTTISPCSVAPSTTTPSSRTGQLLP